MPQCLNEDFTLDSDAAAGAGTIMAIHMDLGTHLSECINANCNLFVEYAKTKAKID